MNGEESLTTIRSAATRPEHACDVRLLDVRRARSSWKAQRKTGGTRTLEVWLHRQRHRRALRTRIEHVVHMLGRVVIADDAIGRVGTKPKTMIEATNPQLRWVNSDN